MDLGAVNEVFGRDGEDCSKEVFFIIGKIVQSGALEVLSRYEREIGVEVFSIASY
jgi:hypothetical protein